MANAGIAKWVNLNTIAIIRGYIVFFNKRSIIHTLTDEIAAKVGAHIIRI